MTRSHRSAAIAVAVILFVAGAQAASDRGKDISEKEGKQILAIFAEHRGLLRVMRRALDAIEKKPTKKANGKRGLLEAGSDVTLTVAVEEDGNEVATATDVIATTPPVFPWPPPKPFGYDPKSPPPPPPLRSPPPPLRSPPPPLRSPPPPLRSPPPPLRSPPPNKPKCPCTCKEPNWSYPGGYCDCPNDPYCDKCVCGYNSCNTYNCG